LGKLLPFMKKIGSIAPKNPEEAARAEQTVIETFARSIKESFTPAELAAMARELDQEELVSMANRELARKVPPTEED